MDENRSIKDVLNDYINSIESKTVAKYTLFKVVYSDNSYSIVSVDYALRNEFLNKHFHVYNHFINKNNGLTIFIEEDER